MAGETSGAKNVGEISAYLRARQALIKIVTPEEDRGTRGAAEAATGADYLVRIWNCIDGVTDLSGAEVTPGKSAQDIGQCLAFIREDKTRAIWILKDLDPWLKDPTVCRAVRNLAMYLPTRPRPEARAIVLIGPSGDMPPELSDHAVTVKWTLPDRTEIGSIYDTAMKGVDAEVGKANLDKREAAVEAAVGLSAQAAARAFKKSLVTQDKKIVPSAIAADKKLVISGKGVEWFEPDPRGLDAVGGLELVKPFLVDCKLDFTEEARAFGLPPPKGIFTVGVPGCGKSLLAKATATAFECPLLRADMGAAQSKWVGESQENIRKVFAIAEAVGRCVLWFDEIEKALAGATGGAADGGVSSDALGVFLSWMQERKGEVFVFATSNDVSKLPPELLRKGRFDELFFVDLPTHSERREIVKVTMKKFKRENEYVDLDAVARASTGFTGSEIDALLPVALRRAFREGKRAVKTEDLVEAAKVTVPLSKTMPEKIDELRKWAKTRARPASLPEAAEKSDGGLDLG